MKVLRITISDFPDYPLITTQDTDYVRALESMLTDHMIFGGPVTLDVGNTLDIHIEVIEMSQAEYDTLEETPWEP